MRCRSCQADIVWLTTKAGKSMPCDWSPERGPDAIHTDYLYGIDISHFSTCPAANQHRRGVPDAKAPLVDKAAHVRAAPQGRDHQCHWPGCTKQVPPAKWGCGQHWFALPAHLRTRVWRAYRPGQELDGRPSAEYLKVAEDVQQWIAAQRNPA